jgi:serine/threonine protein kinase/formylglycine-generating enzyme required for sulfatase activity
MTTEYTVTELLALCLERLSVGEAPGVDDLCKAHPGQAIALRERYERLAALGLLSDESNDGPRSVGPFTLVGLLGKGGMGVVYLGQQAQPVRRLAAIKLMHAGMDTERLLQRFETERQALAVLSHPAIAHVLEAGATDDGRPWFAMEYVEGEPLNDYCDQHELSISDRVSLFVQVCDAITHAHQNGILHRDLKPNNVLVTEHEGRPLVKVIDFGLAKALDQSAGEAALVTQAGQVVGTPAYMSPEQAGVTGEVVDLRTDVYSLGVMLHQLLVGEVPLAPSSGEFLEMQKLLRDVEPLRPSYAVRGASEDLARLRGITLSRWAQQLSNDLDWIVAKALAKDRTRRYAAVSELGADLRRHLRREPVLAGRPSTTYRLRLLFMRHRREAIVAAIGLVGVLVALVMFVTKSLHLEVELKNFNVLAREMALADLVQRAEQDLWPELPETLAAMATWQADVAAIQAEVPLFEGLLERLEREAQTTEAGLAFDEPRTAYLHTHVGDLLATLAAFQAEDGLEPEIAARVDWASGLAARTIEQHRESWDEAVAGIAASPHYQGLQLAPQLGLIPIGEDPESGLWEFAYPRPDELMPRREQGRLVVEDNTCLVFVLVPGGSFQQGAQDADPLSPAYLPEITRPERNGHVVTLDPFFLSKYEMTQGQWLRFTGSNPSDYDLDHEVVHGLFHPVEQLSWDDCERVIGRLGLVLPTGAQWEWAARAATGELWWTGPRSRPSYGCGNLADITLLKATGRGAGFVFDENYDDDWAIHAPVDHYLPNPFGLYNVIGNVWEWCRDAHYLYADAVPRAHDGLQEPLPTVEPELRARELRGGSFYSNFKKARSTFRLQQTKEDANYHFGIRPSRSLDPR